MKHIIAYGLPDAWGSDVTDTEAELYRAEFERIARQRGIDVEWTLDPLGVPDDDRDAGEQIFLSASFQSCLEHVEQ